MTINCNSISKYLFQSGQNQRIETTNLYYDIHTEGNVVVTVRVKARNNMQNTSLAESASQTTASFSKTIVLFFDCTLPSGLCLKQLIIRFNATNTWSFLDATFEIYQISITIPFVVPLSYLSPIKFNTTLNSFSCWWIIRVNKK